MTKAAMRVALKAILRSHTSGRHAEVGEMLAELIDSLGEAPKARAMEPKTGAARTAEWRARRGQNVTKSDVTVTSQTSHGEPLLSLSSSGSEDLSGSENRSEDQEFQSLAPLELSDQPESKEASHVTCDAKSKKIVSRHVTQKRHAVPIPADWVPTDSHRKFAARHGLDIELEVYGFFGFFDGQPVKSPNGRFATWLSNAANRKRERGGFAPNQRPAAEGPRGDAYRIVTPPKGDL